MIDKINFKKCSTCDCYKIPLDVKLSTCQTCLDKLKQKRLLKKQNTVIKQNVEIKQIKYCSNDKCNNVCEDKSELCVKHINLLKKQEEKEKAKEKELNKKLIETQKIHDNIIEERSKLIRDKYTIIKSFNGHRPYKNYNEDPVVNNYWLVSDKQNPNNKFYAMYCNNTHHENSNIVLFSEKSLDYLLKKPDSEEYYTWFILSSGYAAFSYKNKTIHMHTLIQEKEFDVEFKNDGQKLFTRVENNPRDNRITNFKLKNHATCETKISKKSNKENNINKIILPKNKIIIPLYDGEDFENKDINKIIPDCISSTTDTDGHSGKIRVYFKFTYKIPKPDSSGKYDIIKLYSSKSPNITNKEKLNKLIEKVNEFYDGIYSFKNNDNFFEKCYNLVNDIKNKK